MQASNSPPATADRGRDEYSRDYRQPQRFQFRLRTIFLVTTVLCIFLAVPAAAWALGYVTAYIALSIVFVGVLIAIQVPFFYLFDALGWLPSIDETERLTMKDKRDGE